MNVGVSLKKPRKRINFSLFRAGAVLLLASFLTFSSCGIPGGVASCTSTVPQNAVLSYQGSFSPANSSGISGIVKVYLVNNAFTMTIDNLEIPSGVAYSLLLESRDTGVVYTSTARTSKCTQTFSTSAFVGAGNILTQVSIHLTNSTTSTLYATALLNTVFSLR